MGKMKQNHHSKKNTNVGSVTFLLRDGSVTSEDVSVLGNPFCWHGLRLDSETALLKDDFGRCFEPQTGRAVGGK